MPAGITIGRINALLAEGCCPVFLFGSLIPGNAADGIQVDGLSDIVTLAGNGDMGSFEI